MHYFLVHEGELSFVIVLFLAVFSLQFGELVQVLVESILQSLVNSLLVLVYASQPKSRSRWAN